MSGNKPGSRCRDVDPAAGNVRTDDLQCTFDDAQRNHLRDGIALSTAAKIAFFEEMVELAWRFGARDRLAVESSTPSGDAEPRSLLKKD